MNKEENKKAQEKFGDAINSGNLEQLREVGRTGCC